MAVNYFEEDIEQARTREGTGWTMAESIKRQMPHFSESFSAFG
jgi:hypothetical protein